MTAVLARPLLRDPGGSQPRELRPPVVGALLAAGWAALAGSLICGAVAVIGWFTANGGTAQSALRVGIDAWLLAHRVPIELADGRLELPPLGLALLPLGLLYHAGRWVGRTCVIKGRTDVAVGAVTLAVAYAALASLLAVLARTDGAEPHAEWAALATGAAALVAGGTGLLRGSGRLHRTFQKLPTDLRAAAHGALSAVATILLAGAVVLSAALVAHFGRVVSLTEALGAGALGGVLLLLAGFAYVPNAVVFAAAFVAGPGFAVGDGTAVSPTGVSLGPIPAFPLTAALPAPGATPGWMLAVLAVPFLAGMVGGVLAVRRYSAATVDRAAIRGALAGVAGGVAFGLLATIAGGAAGPGRLATVGPPPVETMLLVTVTFALAGAVAAAGSTGWRLWRGAKQDAAANEPTVVVQRDPAD